MGKLSLDEKYKILESNNPLQGEGTDLLKKIMIGAGLGAGGSYLLANTDADEDPKTRRKRIIRNVALGSVLGAGTVGGLSLASDYAQHAIPVLTADGTVRIEDAASDASVKRKSLNFLRDNWGKVTLGTLGAGSGLRGDWKSKERAIDYVREALPAGVKIGPGVSRKALLKELKKKTQLGKALRGLRKTNKNKLVNKSLFNLGLKSKGLAGKVLSTLYRNKRFGILGTLGASTPYLYHKLAPHVADAIMGHDELDD